MRRPRVCIFAEYLYPVVSGGRVPFAGGIEAQLALIGRGLVHCGFDVSVVTCDYGQPDLLRVDGMELLKCYPPHSGLPVLRFFHPRLTLGLSSLLRADADIYVFEGAALWAGIVRELAAARGRKFVWLVAHDHDVMKELPDVSGFRDRTLVRRAIARADAIVSQTENQRRRLREDFGRDSVVIANPVEVPPEARVVDAGRDAGVVWLATYKPSKRPEWFTRFAGRHRNVRCRMAGVVPVPPMDEGCWREAQSAAAGTPNLELHSTIPHEAVGEFLSDSALFAHSSYSEGFPNVFLEAWAYGLPSVTSFDPDGILERERLGACCENYDAWESELERRISDPALRRAEGARARAYVCQSHSPNRILGKLSEVLHGVLGDASGGVTRELRLPAS
jgi:glycosyltransferase involved in cell wall biosynthesis